MLPSVQNAGSGGDTMSLDAHSTKATLSSPLPFVAKADFEFTRSAGRQSDPDKRARLLERATLGHRRTLNALAHQLEGAGYQIDEQLDGYDLLARHEDLGTHLFEVKTWTPSNLGKQVRSGWAQLYEYEYRNRDQLKSDTVRRYLVLDRKPPATFWGWSWLANDLNVVPTWIDSDGLQTYGDYSDRLPPLTPT